MATEDRRMGVVTPDDHGSLIGIAAWFLSVVVVLSIIMRLFIRFSTSHIPGKDDILAVVSMLCAIGSTVAISLAVRSGLGRKVDLIERGNGSDIQKSVYAATILYVVAIGIAKLSIIVLIGRLTLTKMHLKILQALSAVVVAWTVVAVLVTAFECRLPKPWDLFGRQCLDPRPFWYVMSTVDIVTDIFTIVLPILLVWSLQMTQGKKIVIGIAFAFRFVVIAAAICRLYFLGALVKSADKSFDGVAYHICTQCHTALSIIVACIPALKPFLGRAESGMMNLAFNPGAAGTGYGGQGSYGLKNLSKDVSSTGRSGGHQKVWRPDAVDYRAVVTGHGRWSTKIEDRGADAVSLESTGASDQMIIRQTTDWNVQYDHEGNPEAGPSSSPAQLSR